MAENKISPDGIIGDSPRSERILAPASCTPLGLGPAGGGERTPGGGVRRVPQPQMGPPFWPENVMQSSVLVLCCKLLAILHANVIFASHSLLDALGPSRSTRANPRHARCPLYSQPMIPLYTGIIAT